MREVPKEWLDFLREQYPKGSRIRLIEMADDPHPLPEGSMGTLDHIDDAGQFHINWDNGRGLALVIGEDRFSVHPPEPTILKLYMPLTADFYSQDEWGDLPEEGEMWDGYPLLNYEDQILGALIREQMPEEHERGVMYWYDKQDSLNAKVRSAVFTVEERNDQLWGLVECRVIGELSPEELESLKDYLAGQASDGWGESFEQRELKVDEGVLYIHLWSSDDSWSIQTEHERFTPKVAEGLPELCFSTLASTGQLIYIRRGESGYHPSDWDTGNKERNVELADLMNERRGITPAQRQAMEIGSIAGWEVPGADPRHYEIQEEMGRNLSEDNNSGYNHGAIQMGGI